MFRRNLLEQLKITDLFTISLPIRTAAIAAGWYLAACLHIVGTLFKNYLNSRSSKNSSTSKVSDSSSTPGSPIDNSFIRSPIEDSWFSNIYDSILSNSIITTLIERIGGGNPTEIFQSAILLIGFSNFIFTVIILMTYLSKLILSLNYELIWIEKILPKAYGKKVRLIVLKIIKIISMVREYNLIMFMLILIVNSGYLLYFISYFYMNLDEMCKLYIEYKKKG